MSQTLESLHGVIGLPLDVVNCPEVLTATVRAATIANGSGIEIPILKYEDEPSDRHFIRVCTIASYTLELTRSCPEVKIGFVFDELTNEIDGLALRTDIEN